MRPARRLTAPLVAAAVLSLGMGAGPGAAAPATPASAEASSSASSASAPLRLEGLDPQHYMQRRNHLPDVSSALVGLPVATLQRLLKDDGAVAYAGADAYPASFKAAERAAWRHKERRAVKLGALFALSKHATARDGADAPAIAAVVLDAVSDSDIKVAAVAAERLGDVRADDAVSVLAGIAGSDVDDAIRAGACAGLGRVRDEAAAMALVDVVAGAAPDVVKVAAVAALHQVGSSWAWSARGDDARGAQIRAQVVASLSAMPLSGAVDAERQKLVKRWR